jgi:hypothetical protein
VAGYDGTRSLMAYGTHAQWYMYQGDTVTAFLNGEIEEEFYVKQPIIYERYSPTGELLVCRLRKALYKLK